MYKELKYFKHSTDTEFVEYHSPNNESVETKKGVKLLFFSFDSQLLYKSLIKE